MVVSLSGEVDLESSPAARAILLDCVDRGRDVLVDLRGVSYLDRSAIASLVEALQRATQIGRRFALVCVSPEILSILELGRLDRAYPIHRTLAEALDATRAAVG